MKYKNLILLPCLITLCSCNTLYSDEDIKHLTNKDNYKSYTVLFNSVNYSPNNNATLNVNFQTIDEYNLFSGNKLEDENKLISYPIPLTLMEDNYKILDNNKFFEEIKIEDSITIKVSNYKTHTKFFRYISYVSFNDKEYLSLEDGMENIKSYVEFYENPFFK